MSEVATNGLAVPVGDMTMPDFLASGKRPTEARNQRVTNGGESGQTLGMVKRPIPVSKTKKHARSVQGRAREHIQEKAKEQLARIQERAKKRLLAARAAAEVKAKERLAAIRERAKEQEQLARVQEQAKAAREIAQKEERARLARLREAAKLQSQAAQHRELAAKEEERARARLLENQERQAQVWEQAKLRAEEDKKRALAQREARALSRGESLGSLQTSVAARLRAVQLELGRSEHQMAELLGVGRSRWSNWVTGKNLPDELTMCRLHMATGISLDWLYAGEGGKLDPRLFIRLTARMEGIDPDALLPAEAKPPQGQEGSENPPATRDPSAKAAENPAARKAEEASSADRKAEEASSAD